MQETISVSPPRRAGPKLTTARYTSYQNRIEEIEPPPLITKSWKVSPADVIVVPEPFMANIFVAVAVNVPLVKSTFPPTVQVPVPVVIDSALTPAV